MKIAIIYPNLEGTPHNLDMGVVYLATYIDERTNHKVKIISPTFHKRRWESYIRQQVEVFKPDVIGISIVSLFFDYAKTIAKHLKSYHNVPIIVGGFQATMAPEETMEVEEFDAMCIGDGEYTVEEYLNALENNNNLSSIKGLWFRENGKIIKNKLRDYIKDLDALPIPNYDLYDDIDKHLFFMKRLYVLGTRGCPYHCTFCSESVLHQMSTGVRFRARDPKKYVHEIQYLYEKYKHRGMKAAHIYDAVFTFDDKWFKEWAEEYKNVGLAKELPYSCFLKADEQNAKPEKIKLLADTGCLQVRIGIESGDEVVRNKIIQKKGGTDDILLEVISECNKYGFVVKSYCIFGVPGETKKTMQATLKFCWNPFIHLPLCFSYTPIPGTPLAKRELMNVSDKTEKMYSFQHSKGAKIEGVSRRYVPWLILQSYIFFGTRFMWNAFLSNPVTFFPSVISKILWGFFYKAPLPVSAFCALSSPEFWPNLSKRIKKKWQQDVNG